MIKTILASNICDKSAILLKVTLLRRWQTYNFTESDTPPSVFFTFFKVYKMVTNHAADHTVVFSQ